MFNLLLSESIESNLYTNYKFKIITHTCPGRRSFKPNVIDDEARGKVHPTKCPFEPRFKWKILLNCF